MNLLDAISSGLRFKRKKWKKFVSPLKEPTDLIQLTKEDILVHDYLVEERKSITLEELIDAFEKSWYVSSYTLVPYETIWKELKK